MSKARPPFPFLQLRQTMFSSITAHLAHALHVKALKPHRRSSCSLMMLRWLAFPPGCWCVSCRGGGEAGGKATNHEVSGLGHMIVHCVKARQIFAPWGSGDAVSRFVTWAVASLSMPVYRLTKEMEGRVTSGGSCETLQHPSGQTHSAGGLECDVSTALFPLGHKALL